MLIPCLELTELKLPEKEAYKYGHAMFEQLPDIYVDSSKHKQAPSINVLHLSATVMKEGKGEDKEIQL